MKSPARVLALVLALASAAAPAQYTGLSGYGFNNPVSASLDTLLWTRLNSRLIYRTMLKKRGYTDAQLGPMSTDALERALGGAPQARAAARQPPPAPPPTRFKASPKRLVVPALAASLTADKAQQKVLVEIFEAGLAGYDREAGKEQLAGDIAGSTAFFIACAYALAHDGQEPDDNGITMLARQLQQALDTPELRKVSDADKQRFHELLVSLGTWMLVAWKQAVQDGDAATQAKLKRTAADVLEGYLKLEANRYRLTASGLEVTK